MVSYNDVTQVSFSFTASTTGNYTVYFDNREGVFAKTVTFSYSAKTSELGLPPATFILLLTIIIAIIADVIAVVIAVLLLLRRRRRETPKAP